MAREPRFSGGAVIGLAIVSAVILLGVIGGAPPSRSIPTGGAGQSLGTLAGPLGPLFPVNFTESGLPTGSSWTVTFDNASQSSTNRSLIFYSPNGTYSYSIGSVGGLVPTQSTGTLTVQGGNDTVIGTLSVLAAKPWGGAPDPLTGIVFMAYDQNGNLSEINGSTNSNGGNIPVGKSPDTPIYDSIDRNFYVPNWGSNNLTVVNPATGARVANVTIGRSPIAGAFDPSNGMIYVANVADNSVSVINGTSHLLVATLGVGTNPRGVAYDPLDGEVYVTNAGSNNVSVISGTPGSVTATIPLPANSGPLGIAYDSANEKFYVTQQGTAACSGAGPCYGALINASTNAYLGTFVEGPRAAYPSFDPGNGLVYIPNAGNPGTVTVVSSVTQAQIGLITVGNGPETLAVGSNNGLLYSANYAANTVSIINGRFYNLSVNFVPRPPTLYSVNFVESGLPNGASWAVVLNGTRYGGSAPTISTSEGNGTYGFTVGNVSGFQVTPSSGTFQVNGTNVTTVIAFTPLPPHTYSITFAETGLPATTPWSVSLNGTLVNSTGTQISFTRGNGTYVYRIPAIRGFLASPSSGSVAVVGTNSAVAVGFSATPPVRFAVTFREVGLPSNTTWSVDVGSASVSGNSPTLSWTGANGSYAYGVAAISGFSVAPSNGLLTINGSPQTVTIWFNASTSGNGGWLTWGNGNYGGFGRNVIAFLVFLVTAALVLVLALIVLLRRRRMRRAGATVASVAAEEGFPSTIAAGFSPADHQVPEDPAPPPSSLPLARHRPEPPPPKPDWKEE